MASMKEVEQAAERMWSREVDREEEMCDAFVWSELPKDVQLKVLSCLPMRELCRMRCACKESRDVIRRREFRTLYDSAQDPGSQIPSPVICCLESSYPMRLDWLAYDYAARKWKTMNSFPSLPQKTLSQHNARLHSYSLFSVGGLLCLYSWNLPRTRGYLAPGDVSSWTVWHPFRNRWKRLPACKQRMSDRAPVLVHAFVSDARSKTYKILVASHKPVNRQHQYLTDEDTGPHRGLVTEIYDSGTGVWTDGAPHTLRFSRFLPHTVGCFIRRGVLCNGVVYFLMGSRNSFSQNALLSYDATTDHWHEESYPTRYPIFDWDGRLMSIMSQVSEDGDDELLDQYTAYWFVERDPASRRWEHTGIEIPWVKILSKFRYVQRLEIVASGNHLALTGYTTDGSFRIAVYRRAENYWRLPPSAAFSDKIVSNRIEGLFLHTPQLDWRP